MALHKINQMKNNFAGRYIYHAELGKIIAKAVKAEREACAEMLDLVIKSQPYFKFDPIEVVKCVAAIRARGNDGNI